jgi:hypothetical protein
LHILHPFPENQKGGLKTSDPVQWLGKKRISIPESGSV